MESGRTDVQGQPRLQESLSQKKKKRKNNLITRTLTKKTRTTVNSCELKKANKLKFHNINLHTHFFLHRAPFAQDILSTKPRM